MTLGVDRAGHGLGYQSEVAAFLANGGEMGTRIRAYDWTASPLGPPEAWPQSLRTAVSIVLSCAFPHYLVWGPELTSFYNDAYIPIMGDKPEGLGRPFPEVWAEVWHVIGPITERAMRGDASYYENLPLTLTRRGYPEETWFSFSYSPIRDESGGVGGVLCTVHETTQRVLAETALRESEERFRRLTNLIPTFVWYVDPHGAVTFANEQWFTYTGIKDEPAERWPDLVFAPEERDRNRASWLRALEDGTSFDIEARIRRHDGEYRWFLTRAVPVHDAEGRITGWFSAATDIHDRRMAEEAVRESEARLAAILEQLPLGVGLADLQGVITLGNQTLRRYAIDRLPSRNADRTRHWRAFNADGKPLRAADYPGSRALRGETVVPGTDFVFTFPDGRERWTRVSAAPFRNTAGEIVGAIVAIQDVDREKRAEERFRLFAQHSTNVLWIFDLEAQRIEYVSPAFERVWGEPCEAVLKQGTHWLEMIHPDDRDRMAEASERLSQGEVGTQEYRIIRADGSVRWIRDTPFLMRDGDGRVRRAAGIAEDITKDGGPRVYLINADETSRHHQLNFLREAGYEVKTFASGRAFLEVAPILASGCVVLDTRTLEAGGLAIPRELKPRRTELPVIAIGELSTAVQYMKAGAVDFVETLSVGDALLTSIASAVAEIHEAEERNLTANFVRARLAELTAREHEVLDRLLTGGTNKTIARDLGISHRTVEIHRARVMGRLGAQTLPALMQMAVSAGLMTRTGQGDG